MAGWQVKANSVLALLSLLVAAMPVKAGMVASQDSHGARASAPEFIAHAPAVRMLSTSPLDAKLDTSSLHDSATPRLGNGTTLYHLNGVKKGLPATCYGQPCNLSACYPTAVVSVKKHVNHVLVTAAVQFTRRYQASCFADCNGLNEFQRRTTALLNPSQPTCFILCYTQQALCA